MKKTEQVTLLAANNESDRQLKKRKKGRMSPRKAETLVSSSCGNVEKVKVVDL
ncbi:hypothetical protein H6G96_06280 [Nostoc sp. FACHB-892]|uniref:hypothetical protein n=1 Tax=Nostoc sp. FACHB-892 TaxID=2692843 RepID=UPI00168653E6|nr:hypothetical protein [Nostoc sp. FACHB-892]MBD2725938.1 hypothetical protein [Nostoc sp. FACHB-892]